MAAVSTRLTPLTRCQPALRQPPVPAIVQGVGSGSAVSSPLLFTGPCLRATGVSYDVRKATPYWVYDRFDFTVPTGVNGDNYDRYLVRNEEIRQSINIVSLRLPHSRLSCHPR